MNSHLRHHLLPLIAGFMTLASSVSTTHAILDSNQNGLSDIWEKTYNDGDLLPETFDPQDDPDSDGWTNLQEAAAGTNPFDANSPVGIIIPINLHIPATYLGVDANGDPAILTPETETITWPTLAGKQYTLQFSPTLQVGSWQNVGLPAIGNGNPITIANALTQPDGSSPEKLFWRVNVTDIDTDLDELTDAEENELGTSPTYGDSDEDGESDFMEVTQGTLPNDVSNYTFAWRRVEKTLSYDYDDYAPPANTGELDLWASWDTSLSSSETLTEPIPFAELDNRLGAIPFPNLPPLNGSAYTERAPATGFALVLPNPPCYHAYLTHQRLWFTRGVDVIGAFVKKGVIYTDRTLNGTSQTPLFETRSATIPSTEKTSNPIDLVAGFNTNSSGNQAHAESFIEQFVPVEIEDNEFATGVDNTSITAAPTDIGYQEKFWIMAPSGNDAQSPAQPCSNGMKFKVPFNPVVEMDITFPAGAAPTPTPATLILGPEKAPCAWHGTGTTTSESPPAIWNLGKVGQAKTAVDLPIAVKTMKRRTVKVAIYRVQRPGARPFPNRNWPRIAEQLNKIYGSQINAWFQTDFYDVTIQYDTNNNGFLSAHSEDSLSGQEYELLVNDPQLAATNSTHDIKILMIDDIAYTFGEGEEEIHLAGHALTNSKKAVVGVGARGVNSQGGFFIVERTIDQIRQTIAHEIGHVIIGKGHPDEFDANEFGLGGPAPLQSLNRDQQQMERLMCSGSLNNLNSMLMVKGEWDAAEIWLSSRINGDN